MNLPVAPFVPLALAIDVPRSWPAALLAALLLAMASPAAAQPLLDPFGPEPGQPEAPATAGASPGPGQAGQAEAVPAPRLRFELEAVQGMLAVQRLGGWLLYDHRGQNPVAVELVNPAGGATAHRWFYLIPDEGEPVALVHRSEAARFAHLPGRRVVYADYRDFEKQLKGMLRGVRQVAMEYSPRGELPGLSQVDAGTLELVRVQRVKVRSSAELVQLTKALWGADARLTHHVAVHHLQQLRDAALAYVANQVGQGAVVTEHDVQRFLVHGYAVRGLEGPLPVVAVGARAADPQYRPVAGRSAAIQRGDLLLLDMSARVAREGERTIYANVAWMAFVGEHVPEKFARAFEAVVQAREAALALIRERVRRRRVIKGYEVDREARRTLAKAGFGDAFLHRTGHSLDTDVQGAGANLDDYDTHDTRALVMGAGFSVEPGIYVEGEFGMRSAVNAYIGFDGLEVTTAQQKEITTLF